MALMAAVTICALLWVSLYQVVGGRLLGITAEAETTLLGQASAVVQVLIALTLVYLAVSLIWKGYGNMKDIGRIGEEPAVADGGEPGDD
jgi:carbon starvation protein